MSRNGLPPRRFEHSWTGPAGTWAYDRWGEAGRPVVLLHGPTFDRTMWWPVAAELADHATVVAVDLPGHGHSPPRSSYQPSDLVADLANLIHGLNPQRAPIIVGHSISALLACLFAATIKVRATVAVAQSLDIRPITGRLLSCGDLSGPLGQASPDTVPAAYQSLVTPHADDTMLAAYLAWTTNHHPTEAQRVIDGAVRQARTPHLSILGDPPDPGYPLWLRRLAPDARCVVYPQTGLFPHLHQVTRFADDLRALL
ncbi:hypothetical protein Psuf_002670 [Phytohabitans suffuscus]|uniref:AB hydrolase-1 domain-containing protein n=1 Tax=Phytohabitans suffuscus TaxID=624315 RepID=A0A6F8Y9Z6_9ACTN|nr:hypothetical protein Psuf_002670 [Phytohabitans suffuscus]